MSVVDVVRDVLVERGLTEMTARSIAADVVAALSLDDDGRSFPPADPGLPSWTVIETGLFEWLMRAENVRATDPAPARAEWDAVKGARTAMHERVWRRLRSGPASPSELRTATRAESAPRRAREIGVALSLAESSWALVNRRAEGGYQIVARSTLRTNER